MVLIQKIEESLEFKIQNKLHHDKKNKNSIQKHFLFHIRIPNFRHDCVYYKFSSFTFMV